MQRNSHQTIRESYGLKAQMTISAFKTVTARYKTVKEQLRQNPYHYEDEKTGVVNSPAMYPQSPVPEDTSKRAVWEHF